MGDDFEQDLELRHSYSTPQSIQHAPYEILCRSDMNVLHKLHMYKNRDTISNLDRSFQDYYKRYEHDEVPVRDSCFNILTDDKNSITNSELDKLELTIFKKMSQELQTDRSISVTSLESKLKFLKITVQTIFESYYTSMQDFELFKRRFHEILAKKEEHAVVDMENFMKDIIQNIISSETSMINENNRSFENSRCSFKTYDAISKSSIIKGKSSFDSLLESSSRHGSRQSNNYNQSAMGETYKKDGSFTNSAFEETAGKINSAKEVFNIHLLGTPYVQIQRSERSHLSEINIKNPCNPTGDNKQIASAEDMWKRADKKKKNEKYVELDQHNSDGAERDFPVKVSSAKKNIHLDEDFTHEQQADPESFMSKICSFLCKKFRIS